MKNLVAGSALEINPTASGLEGRCEAFRWRITPYTASCVRVQISIDGLFEENPYSLDAGPEADFKSQKTAEGYRLLLGEAILEVAENPFRIRMLNTDGQVLVEDEPGLGHGRMGDQLTAYKRLFPDERFIGLGEKVGPLDRRGQGYQHWNTDAFGYTEDTDPLYLSTPFWMGLHSRNRCYGIFLNNTWRSHINYGASNNRFSSFTVEGGTLDYFLFAGATPADILPQYLHLTGMPMLPPRWSLGFQQCRYSYYPAYEVHTLAETFRKRRIPADVIYLDIHYMDAYKVFTWHPRHFPNYKELLENLKAMGFRVVVIFDPGVRVEEGYQAYDSGVAGDHFATYPDGTRYQGQVWPGWCHFPDFTRERTRAWWSNEMNQVIADGISGFWTDMNEPATWGQRFPDLVQFSMEGRGSHHKEAHNVYGMQMARATYEGSLKHDPDRRPFVLTRAGFSGVQRYAAVWTGDNRSEDSHMLLGVRLVNAMGLSGISFAGTDIGGFVGDAGRALFARWITIGAFTPLCRVHTMINSADSEPWSYGEEVEAIAKNFITLRYKMMPYLYSLFYQATTEGIPVQRSLALTHPFDGCTYRYDNQFWFGPFVMVMPSSAHHHYVKGYLPDYGAPWYSLYEDVRQTPGEVVVEAPLALLPVFVRPGAIIPMQSAVQHTQEADDGILRIHLYNGPDDTEFQLYWDSGDGHAWQKADFLSRRLRWQGNSGTFTLEAREGHYPSPWQSIKLLLHGFEGLSEVRVAGEAMQSHLTEYRFVEPLPAFDPFGNDVTIHKTNVLAVDIAWKEEEISIRLG